MKKIVVKRNRYVDSVTLMSVSERARKTEGVRGAEAVMCTPANRELLSKMGYEVAADAGANDLVLAADGEGDGAARALEAMEETLNRGRRTQKTYRTLDAALADAPYDIAQISLPGEYAGEQAMRALERGLHVFMFSDNVPLEEEKKLKTYAAEHGLLMMGPDCGVAQIGGVCLGAGSILPAGRVGIVGASGSGAQEVACIVASLGEGISELIGTGGRDLYPEIGGIAMMQGMRLLEADARTEVIVLVSKLSDGGVMEKVLACAETLQKKVVAVFLGGDEALFRGHRVIGAHSLEEAAIKAVAALRGREPAFGYSEEELNAVAARELRKYGKEQKYLRGLYCGGTFTEEGLIYYKKHCAGVPLYSNLQTKYTIRLQDKEISYRNTVLDLGAEDFTAEAPHPVFEPNLRIKRLKRELADRSVAVVTLDFITGPGVHEDPVGDFLGEIAAARAVRGDTFTLIANVCGSSLDPQNVPSVRSRLEAAGVIVTASNYQTARLAARLINALKERK